MRDELEPIIQQLEDVLSKGIPETQAFNAVHGAYEKLLMARGMAMGDDEPVYVYWITLEEPGERETHVFANASEVAEQWPPCKPFVLRPDFLEAMVMFEEERIIITRKIE